MPSLSRCEERIPVAAPDQLDDVPAGAAELALELLDDLAVAAHRAVEALQVAVDDEDQVVELLARGQADGAERLGLVHLAVAAEHPDLAVLGVGDAARVQVLEEARLVDRHQRPEAHRDGRELPELGHQLRMRVARDALAVDLLAEVQQLLLGQAAFEEGARVHAGRGMALDVEQVAAVLGRLGVPEVVEAGAEHRRQRGEARDVAAEVAAVRRVQAVRLDHHRHRVPAHVGAQPLLDLDVAGRALFLVGRDRVDVGGVGRERHVDAGLARLVDQLLEQEVGALAALRGDDRRQRVEPLPRFTGVGVVVRGRAGRRSREGLTWASPVMRCSRFVECRTKCRTSTSRCDVSHSGINTGAVGPRRIASGARPRPAASIIAGYAACRDGDEGPPAIQPHLARAPVRALVAAPVGGAPGPLRDARAARLGAALPRGDRLRVLVPAQRGVRARAGSGAPRHRGRAAAAAPAPDREPRAAGAHRARPRHALARSRLVPASRPRASRASGPRPPT